MGCVAMESALEARFGAELSEAFNWALRLTKAQGRGSDQVALLPAMMRHNAGSGRAPAAPQGKAPSSPTDGPGRSRATKHSSLLSKRFSSG